jgi:hypothetical protein
MDMKTMEGLWNESHWKKWSTNLLYAEEERPPPPKPRCPSDFVCLPGRPRVGSCSSELLSSWGLSGLLSLRLRRLRAIYKDVSILQVLVLFRLDVPKSVHHLSDPGCIQQQSLKTLVHHPCQVYQDG